MRKILHWGPAAQHHSFDPGIESPLFIKSMPQCVELLIKQLGQHLSDLYIMEMAYQCTWLPNMISHHQHHHP
jgi:hypothetical protein